VEGKEKAAKTRRKVWEGNETQGKKTEAEEQ
jgi:hypothetical protein